MRAILKAFAVLAVPLLVAAAAPPDPSPVIAAGKAAFEAKCGACHSKDRVNGKVKDMAGWREIVGRMVARANANFAPGEAEAITGYLTARSLLQTSCSNPSCHDLARIDAGREPAAWKTTVSRMQRYAKGAISDEDAAQIAAYLAVERPAKR